MMKKSLLVLALMGMILAPNLSQALNLSVSRLSWTSDLCFQLGNVMAACKPKKNWDTKKEESRNSFRYSLYQWNIERSGKDGICRAYFDVEPFGKTAHHYAERIMKIYRNYKMSGINSQKDVRDGRNRTIIEAYDPNRDMMFLVGVWRNKNSGIMMQCSSKRKEYYDRDKPKFRQFIDSVRITSETTY